MNILTRAFPPVARGLALFGGGFAALNLLGGLGARRFDATLWWIDLRALPDWAATAFAAAVALALLGFALRPHMAPWRRAATIGLLAVTLGITLANALTVWALAARGAIHVGFPLPFSLAVAAGLGVVLIGIVAAKRPALPAWKRRMIVTGVAGLAALAFPLGQMFCFGQTDYRRGADAVVVFGCRAYADGTPSQALADRVRTAVALYHDGLADTLIFSGGPGDGPVHETESMRRLAVSLGVPDHAIILDPAGLDTQRTVDHTARLFDDLGARRVMAVSHFYHLPRIKLTYQRAGWDVYTVPADETRTLTQLPYNMAREVAAAWYYYLRPLAG